MTEKDEKAVSDIQDEMASFVRSEWGETRWIDCSTSLHPDSVVFHVPDANAYIKVPLKDALPPATELEAMQEFKAAGVLVPEGRVVSIGSKDALVTQALEGDPFGPEPTPRDLEDLAVTLKQYSAVPAEAWGRRDESTVTPPTGFADWIPRTLRAIQPVSEQLGLSPEELESALQLCAQILSHSDGPFLTHGDLKPEHCYRVGAKVGLIDLGQSGGGWRGEDLASWATEVDWLSAIKLSELMGLDSKREVAARTIVRSSPFLAWGIQVRDRLHVMKYCEALSLAFGELNR